MAFTLAQLKTELTTDPKGLGYAPLVAAADDAGLEAIINQPRAGTTVRRSDISPQEVLEAIDSRDFEAAPNAIHVAWFESVTQLPTMRLEKDDGTTTTVLANLRRLLVQADTQGSRARIAALARRTGSRAEELYGAGTIVTASDIANARQLP